MPEDGTPYLPFFGGTPDESGRFRDDKGRFIPMPPKSGSESGTTEKQESKRKTEEAAKDLKSIKENTDIAGQMGLFPDMDRDRNFRYTSTDGRAGQIDAKTLDEAGEKLRKMGIYPQTITINEATGKKKGSGTTASPDAGDEKKEAQTFLGILAEVLVGDVKGFFRGIVDSIPGVKQVFKALDIRKKRREARKAEQEGDGTEGIEEDIEAQTAEGIGDLSESTAESDSILMDIIRDSIAAPLASIQLLLTNIDQNVDLLVRETLGSKLEDKEAMNEAKKSKGSGTQRDASGKDGADGEDSSLIGDVLENLPFVPGSRTSRTTTSKGPTKGPTTRGPQKLSRMRRFGKFLAKSKIGRGVLAATALAGGLKNTKVGRFVGGNISKLANTKVGRGLSAAKNVLTKPFFGIGAKSAATAGVASAAGAAIPSIPSTSGLNPIPLEGATPSPSSTPTPSSSVPKKGFFGRMFDKAKSGVKSVGKGLKNVVGAIKNPKEFIKGLVSKAGGASGILKTGIKKIPIIGSLIEGLFTVLDIQNIRNNPELSKEEKKKQIGSRIAQGIGGVLGAAIVGGAGSVLLPGLGSILGAIGGDLAGRFLGDIVANMIGPEKIYNVVSALIPAVSVDSDELPSDIPEEFADAGAVSSQTFAKDTTTDTSEKKTKITQYYDAEGNVVGEMSDESLKTGIGTNIQRTNVSKGVKRVGVDSGNLIEKGFTPVSSTGLPTSTNTNSSKSYANESTSESLTGDSLSMDANNNISNAINAQNDNVNNQTQLAVNNTGGTVNSDGSISIPSSSSALNMLNARGGDSITNNNATVVASSDRSNMESSFFKRPMTVRSEAGIFGTT